MNLKRLYNKSCCVMQWSIGLSKGDIKQVIREKKMDLSFKWFPISEAARSIADPFIFKDAAGELKLLYEDFSMIDEARYGRIILAELDKTFNIRAEKEILDPKSHCSYPFVYLENGKTYIFPETSHQNKLSAWEYDFSGKRLINERVVINNEPLLDSTIFKRDGKYWLFATKSGSGRGNSRLYIYYSDSLFGPYHSHAKNVVKDNIDGSRPAGNIIEVDGEWYRPTQNCGKHYGESISINRITRLSETEFSEELHFKIKPDQDSSFNEGVHTLNVLDDVIVIDGIKMLFKPLTKGRLFLKKKLGK